MVDTFRLAVVLVVSALNGGLALAVLFRNPGKRSHRAFAAAAFLIVAWIALAFLSDQSLMAPVALLLNRLTLGVGALMAASFFYFVLVFPETSTRTPLAWKIYLGCGVLMALLPTVGPYVVLDVQPRPGGTDVVSGHLLWLYAVWLASGLMLMAGVMAAKYRKVGGRERAQLKYVLLGLAVFASVSLLQGLLLPLFLGTYSLATLNTFSTLILVAAASYAMIAHRFMDIRFVVMRSVGYTLMLLLLGAVFVTVSLSARTDVAASAGLTTDLLFAVTCLVTIFLFQPLKRLTEHLTDRLFYRRTYDPDVLLTELGTAVLSTLDQGQLGRLLADTLSREMRLSFAAVALQHDGLLTFSSSSPLFVESSARRLMSCCATGGAVVADELERHTATAQLLRDADVRILLPLGPEKQRVGTVFLGMKQSGGMFSRTDMKFLETISREAAIAARNAQLFDERNRRVGELTAINELAASVGADQDIVPMLDRALALALAASESDSGSVMLLDDEGTGLRMLSAVGLPSEHVRGQRVKVGAGVAGWVAQHGEALLLVDDTDPRFRGEFTRKDVACAISAPIVYDGKIAGVLSVNRQKSRARLFGRDDLDFVVAYVRQLAIALENARLYHDLERTFLGTISALAAAVDAKDPYTYGHSNRVTHYAVATAQRYGLDEGDVQTIRIASILHDIGKIGIDGAILRKPEGLTPEEREIVCKHPSIGADILGSLDFLKDAVPLVLFHHERYGGGGYPSGISESAIPLGARMLAVADAYDAMTSDRPYRSALSNDAARDELQSNSGTQFDPLVVQAFLSVLDDESCSDASVDGALTSVLSFPAAPESDQPCPRSAC